MAALGEPLVALVGALILVLLLADAGPDALRVTAVFLPLAAIVAGLPRRYWPLGVASLVAGWWLAVAAARYVPHVINPWPSVANTVGGAAYLGTPYQGAQLGAVLSVAIPALIVVGLAVFPTALARLRFRPRAARPAAAVRDAPRAGDSPRGSVVMWAGAAILAFTLVPDLRAYLHQESTPLPYGWDTSNIVAWQGFVGMGLVPMKDFFYPYGFQWLYSLRSIGPLFQWLAQIAMLATVAWALFRLTGGRTIRVLACVLAVSLVGAWSPYLWRYLPALLVPLSYGAVGAATHRRLTREHLIFGAVCLLAALIEPDLLALGLVGVVLVLAGELVAGRLAWQRGALLLRGAVDLAPVLTAAAVLLLVWLATGTAAGNLRFYTEFSSVSASSAPDERLFGPASMLVLHPNAFTAYATIPALLAVGGLLWARFGAHRGSIDPDDPARRRRRIADPAAQELCAAYQRPGPPAGARGPGVVADLALGPRLVDSCGHLGGRRRRDALPAQRGRRHDALPRHGDQLTGQCRTLDLRDPRSRSPSQGREPRVRGTAISGLARHGERRVLHRDSSRASDPVVCRRWGLADDVRTSPPSPSLPDRYV